MKLIIVYKSISGFTKKYAQWIAEELKADIFSINDVTIKKLMCYDIIIFGGCLHAVGINGVKIIKKNFNALAEKKVIIFATGASPAREHIPQEILDGNFTREEQEKIRFYYFRGGFDFNKLDFSNKLLMLLLKWKIQLKRNRSADDKGMLAAYSKPMDFTRKEYITDLVVYVRSLE